MGIVYLICGKICSGKTYYARSLREKTNAVILSTDEVTFDLIENEQGDFYNVFAARVNCYLRKKAVEICWAGANVILDWGFWTVADRQEISSFLNGHGILYEWHYIDVTEDIWRQNIAERNRRIEEGDVGSDFYVDEGLLTKLLGLFEAPAAEEMDVITPGRRG